MVCAVVVVVVVVAGTSSSSSTVVKFSWNGIPPPVSGVPLPQIAVPPSKVVAPPPGFVLMVYTMSTGYGWEGIRHVCAMLLGACHVPERLCSGSVYLGRYNKCSTFTFYLYLYTIFLIG